MNTGPLAAHERAFIWLWQRTSPFTIGFPFVFTEEFVRTYGVGGFMRWSKNIVSILRRLEARFGPAEAQILIGLAAFWGGCRWCSIGHVLSGNLELYDREGELGPLDELRLPRLQAMQDAEALEQLTAAYEGSRWAEMKELIRRQYLIRSGQLEPENPDDMLVDETNVIWEWVNECTITEMDTDPALIPPQSPMAKKPELLRRYRQAREARPNGQ